MNYIIVALILIIAILIIRNRYVARLLRDRTMFARGLLRDQSLACRYYSFRQDGYEISSFIQNHGSRVVGYFGFSAFGKLVLRDIMKTEGISIYGIDDTYAEHGLDIDIYHPACNLPNADMIIMLNENAKIKSMIGADDSKVFTLDTIIGEIRK